VAAADVDGGSDGPTDQAGTGAGPAIEPANDTVNNQDAADSQSASTTEAPLAVYGDAAYGAGALLAELEAAGAQIMTKVQPPVAPGGRFAKDRFVIDLGAGTVTCRPTSAWPSDPRRPEAVWRPSPRPAQTARWPPGARLRRAGAESGLATTRPS